MLALVAVMGGNLIGVTLLLERPMSLGMAQRQGDLLDDMSWFCDQSLPKRSVYRFLHRERDRLFPDEMFADLFEHSGRRSVTRWESRTKSEEQMIQAARESMGRRRTRS